MNRRTWKSVGLLVTGGVILQIGGCGAIIAEIIAQNVLVSVLTSALDGLFATA